MMRKLFSLKSVSAKHRALQKQVANESQQLVSRSTAEIVISLLLVLFAVLLVLDLGVEEQSVTGFRCSPIDEDSGLNCHYTYRPNGNIPVFSNNFYTKPIFGKALDVTIFLGLASLLYAIRHASLGSKPYITYTSRKEIEEGGDKWVVKVRNDGLGPAIRPRSACRVRLPSEGGSKSGPEEWISSRLAAEILNNSFPTEVFTFQPLGSGGAISKDKEIEIFSCRTEMAAMIESFEMEIVFDGQYGHTFKKRVLIVPAGLQRGAERAGSRRELRHS